MLCSVSAYCGDANVRAAIERLSFHLLGRHVRGGADARSRSRDAGAESLADAFRQLRDAEVDDLRAAVGGDHDVVRLEIAMHDAGVVRFRQSLGDLRHHFDTLRDAATAAHPLRERHAVDQLHRQEVHVAVGARVVHGHDRWMIERRGRTNFTHETRDAFGIGRAMLRQDFQRHAATELAVFC
jgi:hypothetical protein